jgi:epoxyqueuosine reductase
MNDARHNPVAWASRPSAPAERLAPERSGEAPKPQVEPSPSSSIPVDGYQLAALVKQRARQLGFDLCGIADASPSRYRQYFRDWLDDGRAGAMEYLGRRFDERTDPAAYLPGARTVVCVAMNYHVPLDPPPPATTGPRGRVARYALGKDYHEHIKLKLYELADWLRDTVPGARTRCGVDTAPIMEKELAARAGLGWVGKNDCLINPQIGSWVLLGEVINTLDLPVDEPGRDHCGTCTRCIDACPTHAITAAYQDDARRCISYLTIEHPGEIAEPLRSQMGDWLYGCDVCQDVCPHNHRIPSTTNPALQPRFRNGSLDVREVLNWGADEYRLALRHSAMKRVKLPVLQRNARIVLENLG